MLDLALQPKYYSELSIYKETAQHGSTVNQNSSSSSKLSFTSLFKVLAGVQPSLYPKALGVEWNSSRDTMSTSLCLPIDYQSTKRGVLSDVARTFDVLGCTIIVMKTIRCQPM